MEGKELNIKYISPTVAYIEKSKPPVKCLKPL